MPLGLVDIKRMVDGVVEDVARVLQVDVCVVDECLDVVACTRGFLERKGGRVQKDFLRPLLQQTRVNVLTDPGLHPLCAGCPWRQNCPHSIEIDIPIHAGDRVVGMFSVVGFTPDARKRIVENGEVLMRFFNLQAKLIGYELSFKEAEQKSRYLTAVLESLPEGVAITDTQGRMTHCNSRFLEIARDGPTVCRQAVDQVLSDKLTTGRLQDLTQTEQVTSSKGGAEISARPLVHHGELRGTVVMARAGGRIAVRGDELNRPLLPGVLGRSPALLDAVNRAKRVAQTQTTVLLLGESGTGKELFARAIHQLSERRSGPFIAVNCSAIPETLLESELFGYEGGAFTGARRDGKAGRFELAHGGTLFLDEIGDMPLQFQPKLLRVLESRRIERVGGNRSVPVDIRIIAATNAPLEDMVREGRFRADLYYRLAVVPIRIPPLRERNGDVSLLAQSFLAELAGRYGRAELRWSPQALEALEAYHWPGNVRELINTVEYVVHMSAGPDVLINDLPPSILAGGPGLAQEGQATLNSCVEQAERAVLESALRQGAFTSRSAVAKALGISRSSLYRKLRKHGLR